MSDSVRLAAILCVAIITLVSVLGAAVLTFSGRPDPGLLGYVAANGVGALTGLIVGQKSNGSNGGPNGSASLIIKP